MNHSIRYRLSLVMLPMLLTAAFWAGGCGYPEVSPRTYEISKALYSACNRRSEDHLTKVAGQIAASRDAGEITGSEATWLEDIVATARGGDWEAAMLETRQMMEDQIDR